MFRKKLAKIVFVLGVLLTTVTNINGQIIEPDLQTFLGTLEKYEHTRNDVVFLLDESGSIGADKFPQVKLFTELIARRLSVSSELSRIAVVTFATETITHIDYIKHPDGNNMCTLLKKIRDIGYAAEWTHTDKAMREAKNILSLARQNSHKIIVLLTDGQSNDGHSPVSIARNLKSRGIVIFAIGVADVNEGEIEDVATSKNHTYILRKFDYIQDINKKLVGDLKDVSLDLAKDSSYCNGLCDDNAQCYCGTRTGEYECVCNAGYSGLGGFAGQCNKCTRGTYKENTANTHCTPCPEHSTTRNEGSTTSDDCICNTGYEKFNKTCSPLRCATLSAPEGGILIPKHCNNTYGSQCSFQCFQGYCPFSCNDFYQVHPRGDHSSLPVRTCLESRTWSNEEFLCERMTCTALHFPDNGNHNCTEKDFTHETTCHFECDKGYELSGSESRTCLLGGWTGEEVKCKEISCEKLHTNDRLHVKPSKCGTNSMPYRSVCTYSCVRGYTLVIGGNETNGILECGSDKEWSSGYKKISCKDTEPPKIKCPRSVTVHADPNKGLALVTWDKPNATDNVHVQDISMIEPKSKKKTNIFPIGTTKVVYEATDSSKLKHTCSFLIEVIDKEPPKVESCPSDIEVYHDNKDPIPVTWAGPKFQDNSGKFRETSNRKSGDLFSWGPPSVVYFNATDPSGNTASCKFTVKVKHHPCPYYSPPANGVMTCDNWNDGRLCSIFCHEGFEFASGKDFNDVYYCRRIMKNGKVIWKWEPFMSKKKIKLPWPDCSRIQSPVSLNVSVGVSYSVESCSDQVIRKMQENFFGVVKTLPPLICPVQKGCSPENVKVTCNPVSLARRKRSHKSEVNLMRTGASHKIRHRFHRLNREIQKQKLSISFDIVIYPNETDGTFDTKPKNEHGKISEINLSSNSIIKELEDKISLQVKDMYNVTNIPEPEVNYGVIVMCSVGQISVNNSCINCPPGSYKDDISETCIDCPQATYQDEEGQLSCKACPEGYTTYEVKSKSRNDCKGPCQPGTYSETTFEPCLACPFNTYQDRSTRKECLKCPPGLHTWRIGANASSDCVATCKPGSFSDTGYEPCILCDIGSFQDKAMEKDCTVCPNRTSTTEKGAKTIEDCKEIDICNELHPCQYDSTCIQQDKDYECVCPRGLMGKNCEINFDDCASSPCLNNGSCTDGIANFTCLCPEGWTGHQCEINRDDCASNPCLNGGECIDKVNTYECQCAPGFSGERCQKNIYECESNPCLNNGTCFDKQNGYRCCCAKGYFGLNCENKFNSSICDTVVCQNGGTCLADEEGFYCSCLHGFEGEFCEINNDDCRDVKCENDGVCLDGIENATCICPNKFTGQYCEVALTPEFLLNFPTPTTSNYAKVENKRWLPAITVAFFMRTSVKDPNSRATPVSYSYKYHGHVEDNALTFLDTNNFVLYIHGDQFHTDYAANSDTLWHHYAVTWEKMDGKWLFYVDGDVVSSGNAGKDKYMHPGTFILGQEQDDIGSRFSALEAFAGDITEFNVWDYALTGGEIKSISSTCGYIGNVIPWYTVSLSIHGNVRMLQNVDKCEDLGRCLGSSCDCYYSDSKEEYSCKHDVEECVGACSNGQPCVSDERHSFCNCSKGFEGSRCEYDVDECLENNGGCSYFCVNDIGTGSYHCECPDDMILSEDGKTCKDTSYCVKDKQTYMDGEKWVDYCTNCTCNRGVIQCDEIICPEIECNPLETLITFPGECCAKCIAWSFCLISPNNTVMSFDMSKYQIKGQCTYTAVEDCIEGRFKVQIQSAQNFANESSLIIYQYCYKITVSSDGSVSVDDKMIALPFENEEFVVEEDNMTISVKTSSDLLVQWNFVDEAVIALPITDVNKMCGVCNKLEEYHMYDTGKFPLSERIASVRTLSSDFITFVLSDFYENFLYR